MENSSTRTTPVKHRRATRVRFMVGSAAVAALTAVALACVTTSPDSRETGNLEDYPLAEDALDEGVSAPLAQEPDDSLEARRPESTPSPHPTPFEDITDASPREASGAMVLARCTDSSGARFELAQQGTTPVVTGAFTAPTPKGARAAHVRVSAEFTRVSEDDTGALRFESLSGTAKATHSFASAHASAPLVALRFVDVGNETGRVVIEAGRVTTELSGCHFSLAALKRVRGLSRVALVGGPRVL